MDCIFAKLQMGKFLVKVYEDENVIAFHDLDPQAPTHVLIYSENAYWFCKWKSMRKIVESSDISTRLRQKISGDLGLGKRIPYCK